MWDDYGQRIYNTLQDILQLLQGWQADFQAWTVSFQTFLQGAFDFFASFAVIIGVVVAVSLALRLFFPGYRD